jgi:hypothetical protein
MRDLLKGIITCHDEGVQSVFRNLTCCGFNGVLESAGADYHFTSAAETRVILRATSYFFSLIL